MILIFKYNLLIILISMNIIIDIIFIVNIIEVTLRVIICDP